MNFLAYQWFRFVLKGISLCPAKGSIIQNLCYTKPQLFCVIRVKVWGLYLSSVQNNKGHPCIICIWWPCNVQFERTCAHESEERKQIFIENHSTTIASSAQNLHVGTPGMEALAHWDEMSLRAKKWNGKEIYHSISNSEFKI